MEIYTTYTCPTCNYQLTVIGESAQVGHEHGLTSRNVPKIVPMLRETAPVVGFLSTLTKKDAEQFLDDCATNNLGSTYEAV